MTDRKRILAVSAHPADFCSRSGGTLIRHARDGDLVKVIWLTRGETDESRRLYEQRPDITVDEVRTIREKEAFACAEVMGIEATMLGYGDGPLRMPPERLDRLAREIADFAPSVILTHWKDEVTYPTHWLTVTSTIQAAQIAGQRGNIRFFEPNIGTAARVGFFPDHYVDITEVFEQKIASLEQLTTQPHLVELYTTCARWRGIEARCRYAEAFASLTPEPLLLDRLV